VVHHAEVLATNSLRRGATNALLALSTLLATGCRRPSPRAQIRADVPAPQRVATPRGPVDLSPPRGADAGATGAASLAWVDGGLAAGWIEGDAVRVWRHAGSRWAPLGARLNERPAAGLLRLANLRDGALTAVWTERGANGAVTVRLSRWQGGRWTPVGGPLHEHAATTAVTALAVTGSAEAPLVAMILGGGGPTTLRAVRWSGSRWDNAGPPSLVPPGAQVQTLSAARCGDDRSLLGWVEIGAAGTPTLELRAWSPQQNTWVVLPRADAPLIDAGTHTLAMACDERGALTVGYGWSGGTHGLRRWDPAAETWEDLGLPRESLRGAAVDAGPWLAWRGETLWMSWRPRGAGLSAAVWRAGAWRVLGESLDDRGARGVQGALAPVGTLYVSGVAPSGRVSLVSLTAE
jgi:hypothetical protein